MHAAAIDAYAGLSGVDLRPPKFDLDDAAKVRELYLERFDSAALR